jgi:hypothetical protein
MYRPYIRRAVATKMLYLKRPALMPVLDSLVVAQLGGPSDESVAETVRMIEHVRAEGRANLETLLSIRRLLAARGLERTLVRILDALLWSTHPEAWMGQLPEYVSEIRALVTEGV